jgi:anti-anti-sigma factor
MSGVGDGGLSTRVTRRGSTVQVALCGELDLATAAALRSCLVPLVKQDPPPERLVLDLSDLTFLDASGISALLTVQRLFAARGGELVLRSPSRLVRRVVKVLDLEQVLPVEP